MFAKNDFRNFNFVLLLQADRNRKHLALKVLMVLDSTNSVT